MGLVISSEVKTKLAEKHNVTPREFEQCFENRVGGLLTDNREQHKTTPPTLWFISRTNRQRVLKVVYIQDGPHIYLRTCYLPNQVEINIYNRHAIQPRGSIT